MGSRLKTLRLFPLALMTALAVLLFTSTSASATAPGESTQWANEIEGGHAAYAEGNISEARNPGTGALMQVWHGWGTGNMYIALDHGTTYLMDGLTNSSPQIVWLGHGGNDFMLFHTGTNGFIFYAFGSISYANNGARFPEVSDWQQVPNGAATPNSRSVAVTSLPNNGVFLAFRGASSQEIWGMFYNGQNGRWDLPTVTLGATSDSSPALSYSPSARILLLAYRGLDNQVNVIRQDYGSGVWYGRQILAGLSTDAQPAIAMAPNGWGQVAAREQGSNLLGLNTILESGGSYGWAHEANGLVARYGPTLVMYAYTAYLIATTANGAVLWKQSREF
ncbi:hypothetical protein [Kitasatospora sp. NPDC057223]|uniref:hypothetical protein n=1 Tax=Kitasatospora sp. NPDC057223 TaxID=3346055 RepID=UPI00363A9ACF